MTNLKLIWHRYFFALMRKMLDLQMCDFSEVVSGFAHFIFSTNVRPPRRSSRCPMIYNHLLESQRQSTDLLGGQIFVDLQMCDFSEVVSGFAHFIFSTNVRPPRRSSRCPMIYNHLLESQRQSTDLLGGQIFVATPNGIFSARPR